MLISKVHGSVSAATRKIRDRWSCDEARRRQAMAETMQVHLLKSLRFVPAPASNR